MRSCEFLSKQKKLIIIIIHFQTFTLEKVSALKKPLLLLNPLKTVVSPYMTFYSPFGPPNIPPAFMVYGSKLDATYKPFLIETALTGIEPSEKDRQSFMVNEYNNQYFLFLMYHI